jgi:hypothetical protein
MKDRKPRYPTTFTTRTLEELRKTDLTTTRTLEELRKTDLTTLGLLRKC